MSQAFAVLGLAGLLAAPWPAVAGASVWSALGRLRYEQVEQQSLPDTAQAWTARLGVQVLAPLPTGFSLRAGADGVLHLGAGRFNDTRNGRSSYPTVADPEALELDELALRWRSPGAQPTVSAWAGRQWLYRDNQRFIGGGPGWRQNFQSYDGAGLAWRPRPDLQLDLDGLVNINRGLGDRSPAGDEALDGRLVHLVWSAGPALRTALYAHWLDFGPGEAFAASAAHRNLGLAVTGLQPLEFAILPSGAALAWRIEGAAQRPHAGGAAHNRAQYAVVQFEATLGAFKPLLGLERLGGDGTYGFQTPLASLHAFNGWADRFVQTPASGLRDRYAGLGWGMAPWQLSLVEHDYRADKGTRVYGRETDVQVGYRLRKDLLLTAKLADYRADRSAANSGALRSDVRKLWLQLQWTP